MFDLDSTLLLVSAGVFLVATVVSTIPNSLAAAYGIYIIDLFILAFWFTPQPFVNWMGVLAGYVILGTIWSWIFWKSIIRRRAKKLREVRAEICRKLKVSDNHFSLENQANITGRQDEEYRETIGRAFNISYYSTTWRQITLDVMPDITKYAEMVFTNSLLWPLSLSHYLVTDTITGVVKSTKRSLVARFNQQNNSYFKNFL